MWGYIYNHNTNQKDNFNISFDMPHYIAEI